MNEKNIFSELGLTSSQSNEYVVRDVLSAARSICLRCRKCDERPLKWCIDFDVTEDGKDYWYVHCPETGIVLYNRVSYIVKTGKVPRNFGKGAGILGIL